VSSRSYISRRISRQLTPARNSAHHAAAVAFILAGALKDRFGQGNRHPDQVAVRLDFVSCLMRQRACAAGLPQGSESLDQGRPYRTRVSVAGTPVSLPAGSRPRS
jgi:hypothetical protein